jgi:hypothetical protein
MLTFVKSSEMTAVRTSIGAVRTVAADLIRSRGVVVGVTGSSMRFLLHTTVTRCYVR